LTVKEEKLSEILPNPPVFHKSAIGTQQKGLHFSVLLVQLVVAAQFGAQRIWILASVHNSPEWQPLGVSLADMVELVQENGPAPGSLQPCLGQQRHDELHIGQELQIGGNGLVPTCLRVLLQEVAPRHLLVLAAIFGVKGFQLVGNFARLLTPLGTLNSDTAENEFDKLCAIVALGIGNSQGRVEGEHRGWVVNCWEAIG